MGNESQQILGVSHNGNKLSEAPFIGFSFFPFFSFPIMFLLPGLSSQLNYLVPGSDLGELKLRRVIQQLW